MHPQVYIVLKLMSREAFGRYQCCSRLWSRSNNHHLGIFGVSALSYFKLICVLMPEAHSVLIGGICAEPERQWPNTLGKIALLRRLPYFLPCFVVSLIAFISFLFVALGLREVCIVYSEHRPVTN